MSEFEITQYETASAACSRLDIQSQTLYAYVSRGYLRAISHPDDSRKSLYLSADVDHLLHRKTRGRSRRAVAASTIDSGEPILSSSLTQITDGQFFYRGVNAVELSNSLNLEQVFSLLCETEKKGIDKALFIGSKRLRRTPFTRMLETMNEEAIEARRVGSKAFAFKLLGKLVASAVGETFPAGLTIDNFLAQHWSKDPRAPSLIRQALVLCADHELNASTYASRVAASAGATLPACVLVGLATLSGARHGDLTNQCLRWMNKMSGDLSLAEKELRRLGKKAPPGFGQPLYPLGDPRAVAILQNCPASNQWAGLVDLVLHTSKQHPSLDYGLAVLEDQLKMPRGSGIGIFAIGRSVGWMAHFFEQRKSIKIIRPRASSNNAT